MKKHYRLLMALLLVVATHTVWSQDVLVRGKVLDDSDKNPLPGVNILEKGTTNGALTDSEGEFSIRVKSGATLILSFVGFTPQEILVGDQSFLSVSLRTDARQLDEIVVVGYGEQKKEDLTGAVTAIGAKDFNKGVLSSPQDLLLGKVAGVQITSNSGAPGSGSTIRIRGGSSMSASNDPLIVIDGVPVDNGGIPGMPNALATINPNDIESFTVLKDASATAIYGARASNGVIIITTKKGQEGKPQLSYNGQVSVSSPINYVDVLSADEFRALASQLSEEGSVGLSPAALERLGNASTDWQKEIYRNAISHDHNVSVSGSVKNLPYRASYGYTDQQGILKTTSMQRHTLNLNLNPSFFDDHLKINVNAKGMFSQNNFGNTGAVGAAIAYDPTQPVRNGNSRFGGYHTWVNLSDGDDINGYPNPIGVSNPVALLEQTDNRSDVYRTIGNVQFDYKFHFLPDLKVVLNAGLDHSTSDGFNNAPETAAWTYRSGIGQQINYDGNRQSELLDLYFNYNKELGKSRVDVTGGYSWQHFQREGSNYSRNSDRSIVSDSSYYINENYLLSFFGRLNYSYNNKYRLTATLRADGSSRFVEKPWGLFPAVAFAWNINEESFLSQSNVVSDLKLRLGYGITGQQDIADNQYPALPVYRQSMPTAQYQFGNTFYPTLRPDAYDANIKWEETTTYNVGIDFGLFGDKIVGSVDVYKRTTADLINFIPIAAGSNFSNFLLTNVGNLENRGIEITLRARPITTANVAWNVGVNFTRNINEITKLTKTDDPNYPGVDVGGIDGGVGNFIQNNRVGFPVRSFYVFQQVYNPEGLPIEGLYVDRTGNGGEVISNNLNKYHYNNPAPDVLLGVNSSLSYKNLDFSFSGRFSFGNYAYNNVFSERARYSAIYNQSGFFNNLPSAVNETRFVNAQYWSSHYLEDATFFKMDNMSLGYNVGSVLTQKLKARLSFTVQNAFIVTKYNGLDPEVDGGIDSNIYPRPRVFLMGVNLTY